jgi:hypothetical protein
MLERNGEIGDKEPMSSETKRRPAGTSYSAELTHNDYTVGWVYALSKEQTVATAMLDQISIYPSLMLYYKLTPRRML